MALSDYVHTFGQFMLQRHGKRVHKIALDVGFTCPNRDGSKGLGGCTFCNNASFSPNGRHAPSIAEQMASGRRAIARRTRAQYFMAYFQAYTNTYAAVENLDKLYREALSESDVIGLSIGTRPDCVPDAVLDLLAGYRAEGLEVWLELGLQSAFDETLVRVNRGHGLAEFQSAVLAARQRGIPVCAHMILGLPGEDEMHYQATLDAVLDLGVEGIKVHPLHVVKGTQLANEWRRGDYEPLRMSDYLRQVADLIVRTPEHVVFHRVTGTASKDILLAPAWCSQKWNVLNGIEAELRQRQQYQGQFAHSRHRKQEGILCRPL